MKISHGDHSHSIQLKWTKSAILNQNSEQGAISKDNAVPRSRYLHACCLLGQDLYLFGGKDRYEPLKDFWKLNVDSGEWVNIETREAMLPHLQGHTMVSYKSQIFIFGGTFYETAEDTPLWIYSPDLNLMKKYLCEENLPMPVGRREHSAVIHKNIMYIFGGFMDSCGSSDEFWAFDMESEEWRAVARNKPGRRHGHIAITHSDCMWIHGGMKNLTYLADVWKYDFVLRTWKKIKGFGACPALSGHTANVVSGNIVIFGGCRNGKPSRDTWIFNLSHHTWRSLETSKEILLSPISLHTSVLIDPAKLSANDTEASAKSVPHLQSHKPVLPWHQMTLEGRPWTSPAPTLPKESKTNPSLPSMLPDKNNNSEEDVTTTGINDCQDGSSFVLERPISHAEQSMGNSMDGTSSVCPPKSDILKIRPNSLEDCCDELPLLARFHSVGSDIEYGQCNKVMSLSDESIYHKPLREDQLLKSSLCNDNASHVTPFVSAHRSIESIFEKCYKNPAFHGPGHHSAFMSTSCENKLMRSASSYNRLSIEHGASLTQSHNTLSTEDVENFFSNPLYERLYTQSCYEASCYGCSNEKMFTDVSNSKSQWMYTAQSSDLIVEDLESCEDDLNLRNIKVSFPSNKAVRWSSLKDVSSFCHTLGYNNCDEMSLEIGKQNLIKSLSSSEINYSERSHVPQRMGMDVSRNHPISKQGVKYSRLHSIDEIRRQSRSGQKISRAYMKYSALTKQRNSECFNPLQSDECLMSKDTHGTCYSKSSGVFSLEQGQSRVEVNTSENYNNFTVKPKNDSYGNNVPLKTMNKSYSTKNTSKDQRLVLMILGGQKEMQSYETEALNILNCYIH